ncbi:MAG: outer membrane beta-barrel protein, partial [Granulosicoccus sp.]
MKIWMFAAGVAACTSLQAYAQSADPEGIRAGAFLVKPSVTVSTGFDSNIFTSGDNEEGSFEASVEPRIQVQSDWNRHELQLDAGASYNLFGSSSDDNAINTDVGVTGVIDVTRAFGILLGAGYQRVTEPRGEEDTGLALAEPVVSNSYSANAGVDVVFGRFRVSPAAGVTIRDFKDADLTAGGVDNQDDRDRIEVGTTLEVGYAVQRGIEGFVRGQYDFSDYDQVLDDDGVN